MTAQQETPVNETETPTDNETASNVTEAEPSVTFDDQETDGTTVTITNVTLPEGGFVVIHDELLQEGDALNSVIGTSEYLPAGEYDEVTIRLFEVSGTDSDATTGEETATPTGTPTADETATPAADETATPAGEETATPAGEETATPAADETATPAADETATPAADETATPAATETGTPTADESQERLTEDQTLTAMLHVDSNDNQTFDFVTTFSLEDGPLVVDGEPVTDSANVTVVSNDTATETPTETGATETPTETGATETPTESGTETGTEETPTETETGTPGESSG